jgi:hypothetical protein
VQSRGLLTDDTVLFSGEPFSAPVMTMRNVC